MSKNTGTSELINYFDLGVNGDVGIAGSLDINTIANATTDTDTFLVSDTGIIKYRTGAQLLSDIGAAPAVAGGYLPLTGGTLTGTLNGTSSNFSSNVTIGGNDSAATRLYVRTEDTANTPSLTLFKNINSASSEDIFRVQSWNGAFNTVASIRANGSASFSSSVTAAGVISSSTVRPSSNYAADLGTSSIRWADIFGFSLNVASTITSTLSSGIFLNNSSGGTNATQLRINNTGGDLRLGIESSTGGTIQLGTLAYAAVFGNQANNPVQFTTNGTARMTISSSGNVGIGTSSVTLSYGTGIQIGNATDNNGIRFNVGTGSWGFTEFFQGSTAKFIAGYRDANNTYNIKTGNDLSSSNGITITSGGNVLIGTTTDNGNKLQVNGGATFSNAISPNGGVYALGDVLTSSGRLLASNGSQGANTETASLLLGNRGYFSTSDIGAARISAVATGPNWYNGTALAFYTNPGPDVTSTGAVERMRITSDNNVLFNTTSTGTTNSSSFIFRSGTGAYSGVMIMNHATTNNTGAGFIDCYYNTSYIGGIVQNGASNISFLTSSDYRLKEDLKDFDGLSLILSLKVYDFKWKTEDSRMYGVLAHELQEVVPYTVSGDKDEIKENGKIKVQAIDYSKLVPLLIKAIQEQQIQIQELKNKLS